MSLRMDATLPSSNAPRFNGHPVVVLLPSQLAGRRGIVSLGSTHRSTRVTSFKCTPLALGSCVLPVVANERLVFFYFSVHSLSFSILPAFWIWTARSPPIAQREVMGGKVSF